MEIQSAKIVNEAEEDGNADVWLDADYEVGMKEALSKIRQNYLMSIGSCASNLSPTIIYEELNDFTKLNLKCLNHLGK